MATTVLTKATPCLCSAHPRQDRCITSATLQISEWRPEMYSCTHILNASLAGFLPAHHKIRAAAQSRRLNLSTRAAQSSAKNESLVNEDVDLMKLRLRELSESLVLPASYLEKLPSDLRVDTISFVGLYLLTGKLKDAAFALASGALNKECGEQAGDLLMQLSRTWEGGDTQAAMFAAKQLPSLLEKMSSESSFQSVSKRFVRAGRHFTATGQYEGGELEKIGQALIAAGEALSGGNLPVMEETIITNAKILKFGDLQVDITARGAYIGAGISFAFCLLSWQAAIALQNLFNSSMEYANANASTLATSLRGATLVGGYACVILSAITTVGLLVLARDLNANRE